MYLIVGSNHKVLKFRAIFSVPEKAVQKCQTNPGVSQKVFKVAKCKASSFKRLEQNVPLCIMQIKTMLPPKIVVSLIGTLEFGLKRVQISICCTCAMFANYPVRRITEMTSQNTLLQDQNQIILQQLSGTDTWQGNQ